MLVIYNNKRKNNIFKRTKYNVTNLQLTESSKIRTSFGYILCVTKRDGFSYEFSMNRVLNNLEM